MTTGLVGQYDGSTYTSTQWTDLSGLGNHAVIGGSGLGSSTLNGQTVLTGTTSTTVLWPVGILPSTFTLFHVTRYAPIGSKKRIIQGTSINWLNGFWNRATGVAYHNGFITPSTATVPDDWVLSASTNTTYRANRSLKGSSGAGSPNYDRIAINTGLFSSEISDYLIAEVLVYNRTLSDQEVIDVENYLHYKYLYTYYGQLTSPQVIGGETFSASSLTSDIQFFAADAFDANNNTFWHSASGRYTNGVYKNAVSTTVSGTTRYGEWLQVQFAQSVPMKRITLSPRFNLTVRMPVEFVLAGSNDGSTWTEVFYYSGSPTYVNGTDTNFDVNSTQFFTHYRLFCMRLFNDSLSGSVQITQWKIFDA